MSFIKNLWPAFQSAKTDNLVFKLYYRYTVLILLLFSFIITCRLLFGNSFVCNSDYNNIDVKSYCYTHGPFINLAVLSKNASEEMPYPGISRMRTPSNNLRYFPYYPWVNLFLLLLAILIYVPHLVWKTFEGGLVTKLTSKVNNNCISETERREAIIETAKYVITTRGRHSLYTIVYISTEIFNWIIGILLTASIVSFFNVDMYFSGDVFMIETWDDFFAYNFPLMAMCSYRWYGVSGSVMRFSTLCQLPLNNLYGYMFLFLFAWFIFLCVIQPFVLLYRFVALVLPPIRLFLFRIRSGVTEQTSLTFLDSAFSIGDWFLLTRLQKNLLPHHLTKLLFYVQHNFKKSHMDLEMDDLSKLI